MAIQLRDRESIQGQANFHWTSYILPGFWAFIGLLSLIGQLVGAAKSGFNASTAFFTLIMFATPLLYVWLKNKTKLYIITNQRVYIEEGVVAKSKTDIPLNKINDISLAQGILQRLFGAGNLLVMTGNDKPTILRNIDNPDHFRETLSKSCAVKAS